MPHERTVLSIEARVEQVALVHDNVLEVFEGLLAVDHGSDHAESDVCDLFLAGRGAEDGRKMPEGAHLPVILFEDLLRWLEHQHWTVQLISYASYHNRLPASGR
ncbi:MAG: hypothetical protein WAT86_09565, partial [Flavobacteriales bacterium]